MPSSIQKQCTAIAIFAIACCSIVSGRDVDSIGYVSRCIATTSKSVFLETEYGIYTSDSGGKTWRGFGVSYLIGGSPDHPVVEVGPEPEDRSIRVATLSMTAPPSISVERKDDVRLWNLVSSKLGCGADEHSLKLTFDGGKTWTPGITPFGESSDSSIRGLTWISDREIIVSGLKGSLADISVDDQKIRWRAECGSFVRAVDVHDEKLAVLCDCLIVLEHKSGKELSRTPKLTLRMSGILNSKSCLYVYGGIALAKLPWEGEKLGEPEIILERDIESMFNIDDRIQVIARTDHGADGLFELKDDRLEPQKFHLLQSTVPWDILAEREAASTRPSIPVTPVRLPPAGDIK